MKVKVKVTKRNISRGERFGFYSCPIALSVRPLLKKGLLAGVSHSSLSVENVNVPLPAEARLFVSMFDAGVDPEPIVFSVNLPKKLLKASNP